MVRDAAGRPVVAFQGEAGAYSEQAALELLGAAGIATLGLESFDKVFAAVASGEAAFALVPIENSLGGTIHANYDLQLRHELFIVAEHDFRVRHCLMVQPGVKPSEIVKVLSHPQALAQCDSFLRSRNLVGEAAYDTAGSAKMVSENKDGQLGKCAAIASALAAERYGMEVLETGCEDDNNNFTRFLLLSRRWLPLPAPGTAPLPEDMKTTMVFSLVNNQPGVLVKALSAFSFREIGLTKLESRPDKLRLKGQNLVVAGPPEHQQVPPRDRALIDRLAATVAEAAPPPEAGELGEPGPGAGAALAVAGVSSGAGAGAGAGSGAGAGAGAAPGSGSGSSSGSDNAAAESGGGRFQFVFYVDCIGSLADQRLQNAIRHLSELATFLRVLGCYPKGGVLCDFVAASVGAPHGSVMSTLRAQGRPLAPPPPPELQPQNRSARLKVGIIGFGNFGQFLAKTFTKHADVFACSRTDYRKECAQLGVRYAEDCEAMFAQAAGKLDVLVISVSILSFEGVMRALPMRLLEGVLVVDVLSVKTLPKTVMQVLLPESADVLCTHPMFGPESGKYSWRALPCVYEKVRVAPSVAADLRCEHFLDIFRKAGCRMVEMSCEMHDQAAAGSQFVTHLTGRILGQLQLRSTPINTKGFETLLTLVDNTCKDSFDLFKALYQCNPNSSRQLQAMQEAMSAVTQQLVETGKAGAAPGPGAAEVRFSDFVGRIKPSATSATHARALELKRQGKDIVVTLTVGEPDFAPPKPILDALHEVGPTGMTRYTAVGGLHDLKVAIADDYKRRKAVAYDPTHDVMITHGGKQAIFMAVVSLCQQGDEVLVPAPYWVSYADIAAISGATPVFVDRSAANGYVLTAEQFERALSPRTKMFILCNPCNPTGCTYTREQLEALAAVLRKPQFRHIWVLSDEIYERLTYDGLQHVSFAALDGMKERTLLVNGFAKSHAMTGFRLGWLGCSTRSVIATAIKLQSQLNSCACSTSQYAGVAALRNVSDEMLAPLYRELETKRNAIVQVLRTIPHVVCPVPQGAFYVFPDVSYYLAKGAKSRKTGKLVNNTTDLCNYLIDEHGLALPPGDAFGAPYGVRFSYATSMGDIDKAAERFRAALLGLDLTPV